MILSFLSCAFRWNIVLVACLCFLAACSISPPLPDANPPDDVDENADVILQLPEMPPPSSVDVEKLEHSVIEHSPSVPSIFPPTMSIQPSFPNGSVVAGLILPLSGPMANIGQAMFNAAQLALFEMSDDSVVILPFDSKGTEAGATMAASQALARHVDIIIGPLSSMETRAVAALARPAHVPVLAFTTDRSVAGQGIYVMGLQPGEQAIQVLAFARKKGLARVAVLAPDNEYGRLVSDDVVNSASSIGVTIVGRGLYGAAASDFSGSLKKMMGNKFDILLIPDDGQRMRGLAREIIAHEIDTTSLRLAGTMLWDELRGEASLNGAWYAMPAHKNYAAFEEHYRRAFGEPVPRLAAVAYDTAALVVVLGRGKSHDFSVERITDPQGYIGAAGLLRLNSRGIAERAYAIEEIRAGTPFLEVSPSPERF